MAVSGGGPTRSDRAGWVGRTVHFLRVHPTKRPGANWAIWAVCFLVLVSVASAAGGGHTSTNTTATLGSGSTTTSTLTLAPTTLQASPSSTVGTAPTTTRAESSGSSVINSAGVVLPNPQRTPGATNAQVTQADIDSTICSSGWTATVRPPSNYTTSLKEQQLASGYAYQGDTNPSDYEEDHLIPLELGGSPTSALNLWPEPYNVTDGARTKDQIENKLNSLVCAGSLSLPKAQQMIAVNWFVAYETYIGAPTGTGSGSPSAAPATAAATTVAPTQPASLTCTASMSNSTPSDYSTDDVNVQTASGAAVSAAAHYKTTTTTHTGTADGSGLASIAFNIGGATKGYTVQVDVTVSAGGRTGSCSTSFTPQ